MGRATGRRKALRGHRVGRTALAALLLGLQGLTACLFEAREAEKPPNGGGAIVTLDEPDRAFAAMTASLEKRADADFERALSEQFAFYPLLDDSLDQNLIGTGVYVDWTKEVELFVLNQILAEASAITIDWTTTALINETTFVRWSADYTLRIVASASGDTTTYGGNSQIDVHNEGGNWRIRLWKDISADNGVRTWGYLRGITRLRGGP